MTDLQTTISICHNRSVNDYLRLAGRTIIISKANCHFLYLIDLTLHLGMTLLNRHLKLFFTCQRSKTLIRFLGSQADVINIDAQLSSKPFLLI